MMERRVWAKPIWHGSAEPASMMTVPESSGPRCPRERAAVATSSCETLPHFPTTPKIPHIWSVAVRPARLPQRSLYEEASAQQDLLFCPPCRTARRTIRATTMTCSHCLNGSHCPLSGIKRKSATVKGCLCDHRARSNSGGRCVACSRTLLSKLFHLRSQSLLYAREPLLYIGAFNSLKKGASHISQRTSNSWM